VKFFSRITNKPNSVIEQIKDGLKIVSQKRICVFINGEYETNDPKIIEKLKAHPDRFRTDGPWLSPLKEATLIERIGLGGLNMESKVKSKLLQYQELLIKAEKAGIKTHKMKKEAIIEALIKKEGELKNGIS